VSFRPARRQGSEIILTPLIDIMFTVLLFLVLTATFSEQTAVRISLPRTVTGATTTHDPRIVRIVVDADGRVYVDGQIQTLADVKRRLDAIPEAERSFVTISADEKATHGRVVQIVDLIRQAGIFRLDIETFSGVALDESP
jgi:biopolymer transport protein ExbD